MTDAPKPAAIIPGSENCGCCDGIAARTPQAIDNRIGLDAIRYRIGEYADFRDSLHAGLSSSTYPALAGLRTRDDADFTIGLLDAFACTGDVLTFYQERLANESYLRTATERVSLQEMAKLIGYRLRPGLAAETSLAFALEPPLTPPANLPPDPGAFVTGIPTSLTLAAGLKVQSIPGPDEKPQTFETVEDITARPEWNAIRPWLAEMRKPARNHVDVTLAGSALNLKPGDALLFVGAEFAKAPTTNNNWDFRLIDTVTVDAANNRTIVTWQRGLGSDTPNSDPSAAPDVYVLRKRAGVFGNNAPLWRSMNTEFKNNYASGGASKTEWPDFTISPVSGHIDLDVAATEVLPGSFVALARGEFGSADGSDRYVELYKASGINEVSRAEFALSGKVTRIALTGQNLAEKFFDHPRETRLHAVSELLSLAARPIATNVSGNTVPLAIKADGLLPGRRLIVRGDRADGSGSLVHETGIVSAATDANGVILTIDPMLPSALKRDTVIVHANVALATHGETVTQILGAGNASQAFQRFELKRLPLTYRGAQNELGARSELTVRVGDIAWTEQPTLYGHDPAERAYTLSTDEQGRQSVRFGDGVRGARLPSGVNNVRATYRQGLGTGGNVRADQLSQLQTRPLGLKGVSNPIAASGGSDPEPASQARRSMPLGTRTLGRAVSLLDYADFALASTGIAKAQAQLLQLVGGPTIVITVAGDDGASLPPSNPIWANLWQALHDNGDPHVNLQLLSFQASTFKLGLKVRRDPAYEIKPLLDAVKAALLAFYSFDARDLAQPVFESEVIAVAHSVPGVIAIDLNFLYGGSAPYAQTLPSLQTRLLASTMRVGSGGVALPAELLTLDASSFVQLEEMT